jgi:hypothetical protein
MDLKLRWNSDYKKVWCFFDSSIVVNLVQMNMDMFHIYGNFKWNIKNFCLEIEWLICNILSVSVMLPLLFGLRRVLWMTTTSLSSMNSPDMLYVLLVDVMSIELVRMSLSGFLALIGICSSFLFYFFSFYYLPFCNKKKTLKFKMCK